MDMKDNAHLEILVKAIESLNSLNSQLVYSGGSIISTFLDEESYITIRETKDVDCIVQAYTRSEYEAVAKKLRSLGFQEEFSSGVICRFKSKNLILDLMPTSQKPLGFTNKWFDDGFKFKISRKIDSLEFFTLSAPFFIATKIEAFKGRGNEDYLLSHDIEDIITVFDGCSTLPDQIQSAPESVKEYLKSELKALLANRLFRESIEANVSDRENFEARKTLVLKRIEDSVE